MNQPDPMFEYSKNRYTDKTAAAKYNTKNRGTSKDRLEKACITRALRDIPKGSHVLDLPCGAGRMSHFLFDMGFNVTGADYSEHMVEFAKECFENEGGAGTSEQTVTFEQQDVMNISHDDNSFDAILCNRLLHHYDNPETRRAVLTELARVTRGPLLVSFFSDRNFSTYHGVFKRWMKGKKHERRSAIPMADFLADLEATGFQVDDVLYARKYISLQTYIMASVRK
jgi:2-polyprenyl-3-methyl-5-hydroxy-6-metoxy-1,4-benzoquinol methylase